MNRDSRYNDIIDLPHHDSPTRPRMSLSERAAQFSPFAALTGYEDAVNETARLTTEKIDLDENEKMLLNEKLQFLAVERDDNPVISITYFRPDMKKTGGAYITVTGTVKTIDELTKTIIMTDKTKIKIENILTIKFV